MAVHAIPDRPAAARSRALDHRLWNVDLTREHGFEPLAIDGALPADLRGTLYRNGPGQLGLFGRPYSHPFEGDGAVTAVRFDGATAHGASRITPTAGLVAERAAGKLMYSMAAPWHRRMRAMLGGKVKNTANTSVMMWQGRLFAMMEGAPPTELDPDDLAMRGETKLDGAVLGTFSAHPHRVASRRATYNFGITYGRRSAIELYELPDVGPARHLGAVPLAGAPMLHDFVATDTHLVFFVPPVRVSVPRALLQVGGFDDLFQWRPQLGTEVICVPIDEPDRPLRFTVEAFYQWHFANAFTRGRELVVDYVRYPDFASFYALGDVARQAEALSAGRFHRATIDLAARRLRLRDERVADVTAEFPTIAPRVAGREHAVIYGAVDDLGAIARLDPAAGAVAKHAVADTQRATEPLFVPRPGAIAEDDGYLLALCHDGPRDRAFVAIYDARRIADGPVARAWFDHHIPITFHGTWAAEASAVL